MDRRSFGIDSSFSDFDQMFEELRQRMNELVMGISSFDRFDDVPSSVHYRRMDGSDIEASEDALIASGRVGLPLIATSYDDEQPLIDVREKDDTVTVLVELPGISKEDIDIQVIGKNLIIDVDVPSRKFSKEVPLPCTVKTRSAKASYRSSVLEVVLDKTAPRKRKGPKIKVS